MLELSATWVDPISCFPRPAPTLMSLHTQPCSRAVWGLHSGRSILCITIVHMAHTHLLLCWPSALSPPCPSFNPICLPSAAGPQGASAGCEPNHVQGTQHLCTCSSAFRQAGGTWPGSRQIYFADTDGCLPADTPHSADLQRLFSTLWDLSVPYKILRQSLLDGIKVAFLSTPIASSPPLQLLRSSQHLQRSSVLLYLLCPVQAFQGVGWSLGCKAA